MSSIELQLQFSPKAQRPRTAVLLGGSSPQDWFQEISTWGISLDQVKLYPLPDSRDNLSVRDVIVVFQENPEKFHIPSLSAGYGWFGNRLLIPIEATLFPDVTELEVDELFSVSNRINVWHPHRGLIGFEPEEVLTVADLVKFSQPERTDWSQAQPGVGINSRLHSIEAVWPENPDEVLKSGGKGIGSSKKLLSKLGAQGAAGKVLGAAGIVGGLALTPAALAARLIQSVAPKTSSRASSRGHQPGKLESWANEVLNKSAKLFDARMRSMEKLLKMLQDSPDEGLKYALPMGGNSSGIEGVGGASLMSRLVDFNLASIMGSGGVPVDSWVLPYDVQQQLLHRYRELAEREVHLGRYRRAAYIYAELLGDLNGAAAVLVAGKHYREAAVVYRDKLHRPREAAECLESGGLLHDAIKIYRDLSMYEKVGDLYRNLEEEDLALAAYQQAVKEESDAGKHLEAARILDEKIGQTDAALAELETGWRRSSRARECLEKIFEILSRVGRHSETHSLITGFRTQKFKQAQAIAVVSALETIVHSSPDSALQQHAADTSRVIISRMLKSEPKSARPFLNLLENLSPQDRLLKRDTVRYLKNSRSLYARRGPRPRPAKNWRAKLISNQSLQSSGLKWECFTQSGPYLFCLARNGSDQPVLAIATRGDDRFLQVSYNAWGDMVSTKPVSFSVRETPLKKPVIAVQDHMVAICHPFLELSMIDLGSPGMQPGYSGGTPSFLTEHTINISSSHGMLWALEWPSMNLKGFNRDGLPVSNQQLKTHSGMNLYPDSQVTLLARDSTIYVAMEEVLSQYSIRGHVQFTEFDSPIHKAIESATGTLSRIGVFCEEGGAVCWSRHFEKLPRNLQRPDGVFLRNGNLVIRSADGEWQIYSTESRKLSFLGRIEGIDHTPTAILRHSEPDYVLVCTEAGEIIEYELTPPSLY